MKTETGSFSVNTSSITVLLNDDTINIKSIFFQVGKDSTTSAEESSGFTDGVSHRSRSTLISGSLKESKRSTAYSIIHYRDVSGVSTRKIAGKVVTGGLSTAGEFEMSFDSYDVNTPIDYMVIGI